MVRKEETTVKRRSTAVCMALVMSLTFPGCSEQEVVNDSSACAALPTFSSESELVEFLNEQNAQNYDVAVYSETNPDIFARPSYVPEGYMLEEITLSPGNKSVGHYPFLTYSYLSQEFLEYRESVTHFELGEPGASAEYELLQRQNEYRFNRDTVATENEQLSTRFIQLNHLQESELYPGVYFTKRWNGPGQKDYTMVVWFDDYSFSCAIWMPYDLFNEEVIPTYTEVEYFYIDTGNQTTVAAE